MQMDRHTFERLGCLILENLKQICKEQKKQEAKVIRRIKITLNQAATPVRATRFSVLVLDKSICNQDILKAMYLTLFGVPQERIKLDPEAHEWQNAACKYRMKKMASTSLESQLTLSMEVSYVEKYLKSRSYYRGEVPREGNQSAC